MSTLIAIPLWCIILIVSCFISLYIGYILGMTKALSITELWLEQARDTAAYEGAWASARRFFDVDPPLKPIYPPKTKAKVEKIK